MIFGSGVELSKTTEPDNDPARALYASLGAPAVPIVILANNYDPIARGYVKGSLHNRAAT